MNRLFAARFGNNTDSEYVKSVTIGQVDKKIILFDSHGDIVDISSAVPNFRAKRIISKLRKFI